MSCPNNLRLSRILRNEKNVVDIYRYFSVWYKSSSSSNKSRQKLSGMLNAGTILILKKKKKKSFIRASEIDLLSSVTLKNSMHSVFYFATTARSVFF